MRQVGAFNGKLLVMAAAEATLTRVLDDAADARVEAVKGCPLAGLDDAPSTATPYPPRVTEPDQPNAAAQGAMMRGVEDFPVRPDDDELLVEEFEMLELQPELMGALRSHTRHLATLPARSRNSDGPPRPSTYSTTATTPTTGEGSSASSTAAKAATTSPARCAPRLP